MTAPYEIKYEEHDDYLKAWVSGPEDSIAVSISFWKELRKKAEEVGVTKLLVIEDFPNQLSGGEVFKLAQSLPELLPGIRLAFVDVSKSQLELNKLGEDVVVNRGMLCKVFGDPVRAEDWIKKQAG